MGEFSEQVKKLVSAIKEQGQSKTSKVNINILPDLAAHVMNHSINCYPGNLGSDCYNVAFFFSLDKKKFSGTRGIDLSLKTMLQKIIQHTAGTCKEQTRCVILITDNWNDSTFASWKSTFCELKKNVHIEIYLMTSGKCSQIEI